MAASSFLPMRRNTISSLPAAVSKYHEPFFFTKEIGNGQFSAPTTRVTVPFGSVTNRCISWYLTTNPVRGCSRKLVRLVPALRQRERDWRLRRRQRSVLPTLGRTQVQTNSPKRVRTERILQIEQSSCIQVEQKLKSCAAWYSSPFLNSRYALPLVHAITDVVHRRHENHLQSSTARGRKSLGRFR